MLTSKNIPLTHEHLVVRALVARPPVSVDEIVLWATALVENGLQMSFLHAPIGAYCADEGNKGCTVVAILNSSHLAIHVWDESRPALIQLDVYSCKALNMGKVLQHLDAFFYHGNAVQAV